MGRRRCDQERCADGAPLAQFCEWAVKSHSEIDPELAVTRHRLQRHDLQPPQQRVLHPLAVLSLLLK